MNKKACNVPSGAKSRQIRKARIKFTILSSLLIFALIFTIILISFKIDFTSRNIFSISAKVIYTDSENSSSINCIYENGSVYIPLKEFSDYLDYVISGDKRNIVMTFRESGDYAEFLRHSDEVLVNGQRMFLQNRLIENNSEIYIPAEFFSQYVPNITLGLRHIKNDIDVTITIDTGLKFCFDIADNSSSDTINYKDTLVIPVYSNVFTDTGSQSADVQDEQTEEAVPEIEEPVYTLDLSEYEQYTDVRDSEYLILVNSDNPLAQSYVPEDLEDVCRTRDDKRKTQAIRHNAAKALEALLKDASFNGYADLSVSSGYVSYSDQESLFENQKQLQLKQINKVDEHKLKRITPRAGESEHQTGLSVDLYNTETKTKRFAATDAYKWLILNCAEYGFILRYPEGKENVTGVEFKPWHFRFVGKYHAKKIMSSGITLEEYIENLS